MTVSEQILAKLTTRNIIAVTFVMGYFSFLFFITGADITFQERGIEPFDLEESPVLTMLLGIMSAALIIITQFYFRRTNPQ